MKQVKTDQNTPVDDLLIFSNKVTRSCIDRYILLSEFTKNKSVLSISSGYCYGEAILKVLGAKEVTAIDMDPKAIEYAKQNYGSLINPIVGNFVDDEIDLNKKFDIILSIETYEHVEQDQTKNLTETMLRHGHENTIYIITTPMRKEAVWVDNGGTHRYEYSAEEFTSTIKYQFDGLTTNFMLIGEKHIENNYVSMFIQNIQQHIPLAGAIMVAVIGKNDLFEPKTLNSNKNVEQTNETN